MSVAWERCLNIYNFELSRGLYLSLTNLCWEYLQFSEKLEQLEETLTITAQQVDNAEPVAAHPDKLRDQIADNQTLLEDLEMRMKALDSVRKTADDLLNQPGMDDDSAKGRSVFCFRKENLYLFMIAPFTTFQLNQSYKLFEAAIILKIGIKV